VFSNEIEALGALQAYAAHGAALKLPPHRAGTEPLHV
jgi:hypothetical protein